MKTLQIKHAVRQRDGFRCVECGITAEEHKAKKGRTLQVHRLTPGSEYTVDGCVTLCEKCHGPKRRRYRSLNTGNLTAYASLPREVFRLAKIVATYKEMGVGEYLATFVKPVVTRDLEKIHKGLARD